MCAYFQECVLGFHRGSVYSFAHPHNGKSEFKAKMANNVSVKCVGVCRNVKIVVCGIKVGVDLYVLPTKGEGYPIILGRPWFIAMNPRLD